MGCITLRATCIMPINHVGRDYTLAFTRDGFTISCSTIAHTQGLLDILHKLPKPYAHIQM